MAKHLVSQLTLVVKLPVPNFPFSRATHNVTRQKDLSHKSLDNSQLILHATQTCDSQSESSRHKRTMNERKYMALYPFILERCSDDFVITYIKRRNEGITSSEKGWTYIDTHIKQTLEHRKWMYYAFILISESLTARDREKVHQLVLHHDLSKFSAVEIIGYSLKFSQKEGKELKKASHITRWELALQHHYQNNAHHPQHRSDGRMTTLSLIESIIDILACRMAVNLAGHAESTTEDIFNVPTTSLNGYTESDEKKVTFYLKSWRADVLGAPHRKSLGKKLLM